MDVLRTGVSALGCVLPEAAGHPAAGARDIADRLVASLASMLLYWHHHARNGRTIESYWKRKENRAKIAGISEDDFQRLAAEAKSGCPVSQALAGIPITLEASLA